MKRRAWMGASVAALAAGAGSMTWLRWGSRPTPPAELPWTLSFVQPEGGDLVMREFFGKPLVLNFWATWCPPCIKELPELDRFLRAHAAQGWAVVGLAVDGPTPVREFLRRQPLGFPVGLAGLEGTDLARRLGNDQGGLPFTAVFDRTGRLAHRKMGQTSFEELARWAQGL